MAAPPDIRRHVERLLRGERRTDGLHRIFLWLRLKAARDSAVRDVGNFVGHRDSRDNGISWKRGIDFCHMAAFHYFDRRDPDSLTLDVVRRALRACYRAYGPRSAKAKFNMGYEAVGEKLDKALDKAIDVSREQLLVRGKFTTEEEEIITFYSKRMVVRGAMTGADLLSELIDLLQSEGVLEAPEESELRAQSCFICAYVITQMNGAQLLDGGRSIATLSAHAHHWQPTLSVKVMYHLVGSNIVADIFTTECKTKDWATKEVYNHFTTGVTAPLELDEMGRLTFL